MASENNRRPDDDPPIPPEVVGGKPTEPDLVLTESSRDSTESGTSRDVRRIPVDEIDEPWTDYFRYDSVYSDQVDAIESFIELLADRGIYLLEGACGTGKTLAAVTGGIHAVRDRSHLSAELCDTGETFPEYRRVFVVTPVKQQLAQFVNEMRGVNSSLPDGVKPIPTVVLRGRHDMMAYSYVDDIPPFDEQSLNERIDGLRDMTRKIIKFDSDVPLDWPDEITPPEFSLYDYDWDEASTEAEQHRDRFTYDPYRAAAVVSIVSDLANKDTVDYDTLVVDGIESPYPEYVPHTNDVVDMDELRLRGMGQLPTDLLGKFDPFYAGFHAGDKGLPFWFSSAESHVFDKDSLFKEAIKRGICPHEAMAKLAKHAEVVLGNYNHMFDPQTRMLTEEKIGLLDSDTVFVIDEAHQVEKRTRDMLSADLDIYTLQKAIKDVDIIRNYAIGDYKKTETPDLSRRDANRAKGLVKKSLKTAGSFSVTVEELAEAEKFLRFVETKLGEYGAQKLNERYSDVSWQRAVDQWGPDKLEKGLSDPEDPTDIDRLLIDVVEQTQFDESTFKTMYKVMLGVKFAYDALRDKGIYDRTPQGVGVGDFFYRWVTEDRVEYFHQLILDDRPKDSVPDSMPEWVRGWTPKFQLFNCIPREELAEVFGELGGGVLMSATIEPADVYREAVGIDDVSYPSDDEDDSGDESDSESDADVGTSTGTRHGSPDSDPDTETRPCGYDQYPLRFPNENRLSLTVDLPKYTNRNRGRPVTDESQMTEVRLQYAQTIKKLVESQGNVLVAMPNYREAKWIYEYLDEIGVSKRLHLDQSSSDRETTENLQSFFESGDAAIFTSSRGTITEGVDYDGAKLHCCVAVGIPLLPTNQPRVKAIRAAYDDRIDSKSGFETALTIPAVRKTRQAIGRVIRGSDEAGVRVLLDERYDSNGWGGVKKYLSEQEQREFNLTVPSGVDRVVSAFWDDINERPDIDPFASVEIETGSSSTGGSDGTKSQTVLPSTPTQTSGSSESPSDLDHTASSAQKDCEQTSDEYAKIYFGKEANFSGWTDVQLDVALNEIVPVIRDNIVKESEGVETIKFHFSKELPLSGWVDVKADAVFEDIEPLVDQARP